MQKLEEFVKGEVFQSSVIKYTRSVLMQMFAIIAFFSTIIIGLLIYIFNDRDESLRSLDQTVAKLSTSITGLGLTIRLSNKDIENINEKVKVNIKAIGDLQELHKNNK